ncbi:MAG: LysM peptidoglycan-binding domain-containing protein [Anaerolineales bacterium]|nr:LysM peptidoglycan-binding domain-containing protein [Anaerolineales bacterium]
MHIKRVLMIMLLAAVIIGSSGCVKSASKSTATPTTEEEESFPVPGTPDDIMSQLESFATQTAIAIEGPILEIEETPEAPSEGTTEESAMLEITPTVAQTEESVVAAPTEALSAIPTTAKEVPNSYTVRRGEFPYCLARRFDVNPVSLLNVNGLTEGSVLHEGMTLRIPKNTDFPGKRALKNHPTTYTVSSGDTIYTIACEFGDVDPISIAEVNGLTSPYKLTPGQKITIP